MNEKEYLISIIKIIDFILKIKNNIIINLIIVSVLSGIYLYRMPNLYLAKATFLSPAGTIEKGELSFANTSSASSVNLSNLINGSSNSLDDIYVKLLRSVPLNEHIVKKFNLLEKLKIEKLDDAINMLKGIVTVVNDNSGYMEVKVRNKDPKLASDIANEYVNYLSYFITEFVNSKGLNSQNEFLTKRINSVKEELEINNTKLINFELSNKAISPEKQGDSTLNKISTLQMQVISNESEKKALEVLYSENSPKIKSINERINNLKKEINLLTQENPTKKTSSYDMNLNQYPSLAKNYVKLLREIKIKEEILNFLVNQLEIIKLKEAKEKVNIIIIDKATPPTEKEGPKRTLAMIIICLITIVLTLLYYSIKSKVLRLENEHKEIYEELQNLKKSFRKAIFLS
ncbi:MAG: GNVR domain-containing protein [Cyanobacteriota bacterium]